MSHVRPPTFKFKLIRRKRNTKKIPFFSYSSHTAGAQWPHVARVSRTVWVQDSPPHRNSVGPLNFQENPKGRSQVESASRKGSFWNRMADSLPQCGRHALRGAVGRPLLGSETQDKWVMCTLGTPSPRQWQRTEPGDERGPPGPPLLLVTGNSASAGTGPWELRELFPDVAKLPHSPQHHIAITWSHLYAHRF